MPDNITLNSGSGGASLASDEISGVQHQRVKIQYGADGSATDVSDTNPLPIDDAGGSITVDDGGTSLTVDGTVTAELSATDNAVLDQIEVNTSYGDQTGGGTETGALRVTLANNSTGVLSVDDNGGSLTVDGTVTANAGTGTMTVTDDGSFTLAANSGTDIGDVDVTSVVPGTAATNLGKAQDSAVGGTDTGVAALYKRDDEQSAVTPADGDYVVPTCDRFGKVKITEMPDATSEVKYASIDAATSGDNTLVAAAGAGVRIRVLSVFLMSSGTVNTRFEDGASGTALTGQMNLTAQSGYVLPYNPHGWFQTSDNTLLNLELSAAVSVDGCLTYVEV